MLSNWNKANFRAGEETIFGDTWALPDNILKEFIWFYVKHIIFICQVTNNYSPQIHIVEWKVSIWDVVEQK